MAITAEQPANPRHAAADKCASDLFASIAAIGTGSDPMRARVRQIAELLSRDFAATSTLVAMAIGGEEVTHSESREGADPAWEEPLHSAALEVHVSGERFARIYADAHGEPAFVVLAAPIMRRGSPPTGGVALVCSCHSTTQAEVDLGLLRAACAQAAVALTQSVPVLDAEHQIEDLSRVFSKAGDYQSAHHFAFAIANTLRNKLGCDQAAMGTVDDDRVNLLCISGLDEIKRRSPGVLRIQQSMGECADRGTAIVAQADDRWNEAFAGAKHHLHERWRLASGDSCVASLPVVAGDRVVAVVSLRRPAGRPFGQGEIETAARLIAPLAGAIPLVREATRSTAARARADLRRLVRWLVASRSPGRKLLLGLLIVAATWIAVGEGDYQLTVPATVVADRQHVVAAPVQGRISEVFVRTGDRVEAGQRLLAIDTRDLVSELSQIEAEIERLNISLRATAGQRDPAMASVLQREIETLSGRRGLVERRLKLADICAPIDGLILSEDVEGLAGRIVPVGEPLITVADASSFLLELRSPNGRIVDLRPGESLRFVSHARPELTGDSLLARVSGVASERESEWVFLAEAPIPRGQDWLRPGMDGVARIDVGKRPIWWLATHRIVDTARLNFWFD
jgi:multidrug resistance efflux pump